MFLIISGCGGVCMMRTTWRDEQHPSFINFISNFLTTNSFRLNFVSIPPVISFNFLIRYFYLCKKKKSLKEVWFITHSTP